MLDPAFTDRMQRYLAQTSDHRDVAQGALLLFQLTGNAYLYHNALLHPDKYAPTIEHELKKHLRIRLDGLTRAQVAQMERESLPRIQETLGGDASNLLGDDDSRRRLSTSTKRAPKATTTSGPTISTDTDQPTAQHLGRRADHDRLPANIQELYEQNGTIYYKMKTLYNQLLTLNDREPCDRYELLKQLRAADDKYRANWKTYDEYQVLSNK